jgi:hypothetical protein
VNTSSLSVPIMHISLIPTIVQKDSSVVPTGQNLHVLSFPGHQVATVSFPVSSGGDNNSSITNPTNVNNTLMVPMYFNQSSSSWVNTGCQVTNTTQNPSPMINAACAQLSVPSPVQTLKNAPFSTTIDIFSNLLSVLASGNYAMLYNFAAFLTAGSANYGVLAVIFICAIFLAISAYRLNVMDTKDLFIERISTLNEKFSPFKKPMEEGLLANVFSLFSKIKNKGIEKTLQIQVEKNDKKQLDCITDRKFDVEKPEENDKITNPKSCLKLTEREKKEIKTLYHYYLELSNLYPEEEIIQKISDEINDSKVLTRLTQARIEDLLANSPPSACIILEVIYIGFIN